MNGSAGFLNRALWDAGYQEHELQFTNAIKLDGNHRDLRNLYHGRVVLACGKVAQDTCLRQGMPHLPLPHPQYVKRFGKPPRSEYVGLLRQFRIGGS